MPNVPDTSAPPHATSGVGAPIVVALAATAGCLALAAIGPTDDGMPLCPTKFVTGIDCPFCGGLRCAASLGRLDIGAALDHNVLVVALLPLVAFWWTAWLMRRRSNPTATPPSIPDALLRGILLAALIFTVARNTVGGAVGAFLDAAA